MKTPQSHFPGMVYPDDCLLSNMPGHLKNSLPPNGTIDWQLYLQHMTFREYSGANYTKCPFISFINMEFEMLVLIGS